MAFDRDNIRLIGKGTGDRDNSGDFIKMPYKKVEKFAEISPKMNFLVCPFPYQKIVS